MVEPFSIDHFMGLLLYHAGGYSEDPSTQNAALLYNPADLHDETIVNTLAVNSFPRGVKALPERWERPLKWAYVEHAERNSIYEAAIRGFSTYGLTMVSPWAACADCARAIIQAGVLELITLHPDPIPIERWDESIQIGLGMLDEAGVKVTYVDPPPGEFSLLRDGAPWSPTPLAVASVP